MKVLIVSPYYPPDLGPSAPLIAMLAEDLVKMGHAVTVIAAVPHFPTGIVQKAYCKRLIFRSVENGVTVYRVRVPSGDRKKLFHRQLVFLIYQAAAALLGLRIDFDRVIITNPAIETFLPYMVISRWKRKPAVFCVWDIYPEIGIKNGVFRHALVIRFVGGLEDYCLARAEKIHVLSEEMGNQLRAGHPVDQERLFVQAPWIDENVVYQPDGPNPFLLQNDLANCFVVLYSGNIGPSQGLDAVLEAASALQKNRGIRFVFIGDGAEKEKLVERARVEGIGNVIFLPFQPAERYPEVLASAGVCLISLKAGIAEESIPSKTFTIMANGRPVIAFVEPGSGVWKLIEKSGAGVNVSNTDVNDLAFMVETLSQCPDRLDEMGLKGLKYASQNFSRKTAADNFLKQLISI